MVSLGTGSRAAAALALLACLCFPANCQQSSSVCYEGVGCFNSQNGTFKGVVDNLPPFSPEQMETTFKLFTRQNKAEGQPLDYLDEDSVSTELFQPFKTLYVLVHGFQDVGEASARRILKSALLDQSDCQVLIMDWRRGANGPYWQATVNTEMAGRQLAQLLNLLRTGRALDPSRVHLVGYSLGAQLMGFAGKWTRDQHGFLLGRLTALDPAGPLFEDSGPSVHIWKDDAEFVDIIHTSAGRNLLFGENGMEKIVGHVDFFPNGGKEQPGCPQFHPDCSHIRADDLFLESVASSESCFFASIPCAGGYEAFQRGDCSGCGTQGCGRLGLPSREAPGRGIQYLDTNDKKPFCKTYYS